jgi:hypothetical protein
MLDHPMPTSITGPLGRGNSRGEWRLTYWPVVLDDLLDSRAGLDNIDHPEIRDVTNIG